LKGKEDRKAGEKKGDRNWGEKLIEKKGAHLILCRHNWSTPHKRKEFTEKTAPAPAPAPAEEEEEERRKKKESHKIHFTKEERKKS